MRFRECLSFDDVLLLPEYSDIRSRLEVDTSTDVGGIKLSVPIISSAMDTITEYDMASKMAQLGGMGIIHRFLSKENHLAQLKSLIIRKNEHHVTSGNSFPVVLAVGVKEDERTRLDFIMNEIGQDIDMVSIDIANGHSIVMAEMISYVREKYANVKVMAGNVATRHGFEFLANYGAHAVRAGIGGGSICATRIQTAAGSPTFQTLLDIKYSKETTTSSLVRSCSVIADGGIRYPKDFVLSLAAGASAIMCGNILAGTIETPGKTIINESGQRLKQYRGMASQSVQEDLRGGLKTGTCAEGVTTFVTEKGSVSVVVDEFVGGLRSGMSYQNARTISELQSSPSFIKITNAGIEESHAFGTKKP